MLQKTIYMRFVFCYADSAQALNKPRERMETAEQGLLTRDEMESRRLLAAQELQRGLTQSQVARKFGVSRTTASRWNRALSGCGVEALRKRRAPGRPSRLTPEQLAVVTEIYQAGPRAAGFDADRWTTVRLGEAIHVRFGVRYDPDHVGRIIHRLGLRERQRPRQRDGILSMPSPLVALPEPASSVA